VNAPTTGGSRRSRPRWPFVVGSLAIGLTVTWLAVFMSDRVSGGSIPTAGRPATAVLDGRPAPPFDLASVAGSGRVALSGYRGRLLVVNFWASWCDPCRREAPGLQEVWTEYRGRGVQFVGIDHMDGRSSARAFIAELGLTYPVGWDPTGEVAARYGLRGLPTTLVIGPDGRVMFRLLGPVEATTIRDLLERALTG
jgi:cytochrome c biogenesis protein CcmG, thiol:disulfide interchange protein DsbE